MLPPDLLMIFYVTSSSVDEPPLSPTSGFTVGNPRLQNLFFKMQIKCVLEESMHHAIHMIIHIDLSFKTKKSLIFEEY